MKSGATESCFYYLAQHYKFPENVDVRRTTYEIIQSNKQYKIIWAHDNCDQAGHATLPQHIDEIDKIVCVSNWEREQYIKYNRAPAEKLVVISNGVDDMFRPSGKQKSKTCIFFSAPHKGITPLVPIWKEVIKHHPDAKLKVFSSMSLYGDIQPGEGDNETITTENGLEPSPFIPVYKELQALPGVEYSPCIDREELLPHIQDAAFYIHPNVWEETFCVSLAEAMSCGCFPITTDMGALPETSNGMGKYIPMSGQNTKRGWITDDTFHQNFAEEIIRALHFFDVAKDEFNKVSKTISDYAIENYNWRSIAAEWNNLIEVVTKKAVFIDDEHIFDQVYTKNEYDITTFNDDDIVIDIGAHKGFFTKLCLDKGCKNIHSFEPEPRNFDDLLKNLKDYKNFQAYNFAVLDKQGEKDFTVSSSWNTGIHSFYLNKGNTIKVKTVGLDDILKNFPKVSLLKIDSEGSEYEILYNSKLLDKVETIVGEYHDGLNQYTIETLKDYLQKNNFTVEITRVFNSSSGIFLAKRKNNKVFFRPNTSDDLIFQHVYLENEYGIPDELDKTDVIIDIGAHCGYFTKLCLDRGSKNVVCFEPEKENYQYLLKNLSFYSGWKSFNLAIWKENLDEIELHTYPTLYNTGLNSVYEIKSVDDNKSTIQKVKCISLDEILSQLDKVKILKIDVEGSEYEILMNSKLIDKVEIIVAEYHGPDDRLNYDIKDLEKYLKEKNFEVKITSSKFVAIKKSNDKPKVIDSFMFFNEFDILKLRLLYLNDIVDNFIICESNYTHSGKQKPYYLDDIINEIPEDIRKKIIRIKYEPDINQMDFPTEIIGDDYTNDYWKLERQQRNLISQNLNNFSPDDFFMISDVDEIPRRDVIQNLVSQKKDKDFCYVASCELFYYNFNTFYLDNWGGTIFTNVSNAIEKGCDYFRALRNSNFTPIKNGGWHFTYFGGVSQIQNKLESFAHQECNIDENKNTDNIIDSIKNKKSFIKGGDKFTNYKFDNFPKELQDAIIKVYPKEYYKGDFEPMVNVCFSIIPPRFSNLDVVIESFQNQTKVPDKVIVTIPKKYHRFSYDIEEIKNISKKYEGFAHFLFVDEDYGPATKIYGGIKSLELYPDSNIMVCDDDVIYDERLLECYSKAIKTDDDCVWTTAKATEHNANDLKLPNHQIHKLQGVDTYLFTPKILEKINSNNFEQKYIDFLQKNTDIKSLEDVFLHDDYFISILLYDHKIPVKSFYLKHTVYENLISDKQIHESLKCHSDEAKLIQRIYKNYENSNVKIRCDFKNINGDKIGEFLIDDSFDVEKYHHYIINVYKRYGTFKMGININPEETMNTLLDKKTNDLQEFYDWQIKHFVMNDNYVDYMFRLKYWNNFNPKVIYDIGSNYLSWHKLASNVWRDAKIYCFDAFSKFEDVYPKYNIDYSLEVLSDKEKEVEFWESPLCPGLCTIYPMNELFDEFKIFHNENLTKTIRRTKTLDSLIKEKGWLKPDLIKMDVQGAEVDVLRGAQEVILNCNHLLLEIQTTDFSLGAPKLDEVESYLNSIGFVLFHQFSSTDHDGDYHFVRENILHK